MLKSDGKSLKFQHKELEQYLVQPKGDYNPDMPIDEQTSCIPYDAKWEFPKERLRLGKKISDLEKCYLRLCYSISFFHLYKGT